MGGGHVFSGGKSGSSMFLDCTHKHVVAFSHVYWISRRARFGLTFDAEVGAVDHPPPCLQVIKLGNFVQQASLTSMHSGTLFHKDTECS